MKRTHLRYLGEPPWDLVPLPYWEWEEIRRCDTVEQRAFWEKKLGEGTQRWWLDRGDLGVQGPTANRQRGGAREQPSGSSLGCRPPRAN